MPLRRLRLPPNATSIRGGRTPGLCAGDHGRGQAERGGSGAEDFSAGGVAFRVGTEGHEAALIATRGGTRWQLPKGTCEPGETLEQTAIREVEEEVGLRTQVVTFLHPIEYWYWDTYQRSVPELVHKRVDFFLLRVNGRHPHRWLL